MGVPTATEHSETHHLSGINKGIEAMGFTVVQPILVIAGSIIVGMFRKECPATDSHPRQGGWRSDRTHPESFLTLA